MALCDLVLPDMSGVEFFSRIANPEAMRVPLTDCRDPDEVIRSVTEGEGMEVWHDWLRHKRAHQPSLVPA